MEKYTERKTMIEEIRQNFSVESKIKQICYDMMINVLESTASTSGDRQDTAKHLAKVLQKTKNDDLGSSQSSI